MRAALAAPDRPLPVRALASHGTDDPAIALLDAWAVVSDVVAFYSERIATEGYLRTATELRSVRELARTLGYELRPGVAAQADLAVTVETAPGAPQVVDVPAGTPVQSVPVAGQLPQTFETSDALEARGVWNALPVVSSRPQVLARGTTTLWLRATASPVRAGDHVVVVGTRFGVRRAQVRRVAAAAVAPADPSVPAGWVRLDLDTGIEVVGPGFPAVLTDVEVHALTVRTRLFGWNAPDPNLLVVEGTPPAGAVGTTAGGDGVVDEPPYVWAGYDLGSPLEVDGAHPAVLPGSWLILVQGGTDEVYLVSDAVLDGAARWTLSGPTTVVTPEADTGITAFDRRRASVLCGSVPLPGGEQPDDLALTGRTIVVAAVDPPLPAGRRVVLRGTEHATGAPAVETATVQTCVVDPGGATMTLTLAADLARGYSRRGLVVLGNVCLATHGETVSQVLGSGDARAGFATFRPRRAPLTHVRATTPDGEQAALVVRVDGVAWSEVAALEDAGPQDRVYALHADEDGAVRIVLGDGVHGARPASGQENVTATYRVGIGGTGAVDAGQLSLLPRRPFGVKAVTNPAPAQDWADAETIEQARTNAPLRVRTLDRAVSVADHEDVARGYAGVGPARADLVWDGRSHRVVVTVLGTEAAAPSGDLVAALRATLVAVRDPGTALEVLPGAQTWFGVRVEVAHDPAVERDAVLAAVADALAAGLGAPVRPFAAAVTPATVLVAVRSVPGVAACTVPRLLPLASLPAPPEVPVLPPDSAALAVVPALPARWDGAALPAQLLSLAPGAVDLGEMVL
jgi:predicted phage baseplate assembly protein